MSWLTESCLFEMIIMARGFIFINFYYFNYNFYSKKEEVFIHFLRPIISIQEAHKNKNEDNYALGLVSRLQRSVQEL